MGFILKNFLGEDPQTPCCWASPLLEGGVILRFLEIRCEDTLKVLSRLKDDGEYFFLFFKLGVTPLYTPSEVYPKHSKNAFLGQKCQFLNFFGVKCTKYVEEDI